MNVTGNLIFFDGKLICSKEAQNIKINAKNCIYEVLRVFRGNPLFLEDHLERLQNSINFLHIQVNIDTLISAIKQVINENNISNGNIRIDIYPFKNHKITSAVYFVPHYYPPPSFYTDGVKLISYHVERLNPHIKQTVVNDLLREKISISKEKENAFEVLLITNNEEITEGSKSNILFVCGKNIYTPPSELILEGITRKKVIQLAKSLAYKIVEDSIHLHSLHSFDGCFLTGTSPKVLPVSSIDSIRFDPKNKVINHLMREYEAMMEKYCNQ